MKVMAWPDSIDCNSSCYNTHIIEDMNNSFHTVMVLEFSKMTSNLLTSNLVEKNKTCFCVQIQNKNSMFRVQYPQTLKKNIKYIFLQICGDPS